MVLFNVILHTIVASLNRRILNLKLHLLKHIKTDLCVLLIYFKEIVFKWIFSQIGLKSMIVVMAKINVVLFWFLSDKVPVFHLKNLWLIQNSLAVLRSAENLKAKCHILHQTHPAHPIPSLFKRSSCPSPKSHCWISQNATGCTNNKDES